MSRAEEFRKEISTLSAMEKELEEFISSLRKEQSEFRLFLNEIEASSFNAGVAKEAFFSRVLQYHDTFARKVQLLEDATVAIIEDRKLVERLLQQELMKPVSPFGKF